MKAVDTTGARSGGRPTAVSGPAAAASAAARWRGANRLTLAGVLLSVCCALFLADKACAAPTAPTETSAMSPSAAPSVALYYGAEPPLDELAAFDWVVLEPGHPRDIGRAAAHMPRSKLLAYLSVGEIQTHRPYFDTMPPAWRIGRNEAWQSEVVDQSSPDWPRWFVETVARPQWQRGFRGFFLDTLDSYRLVDGGANGAAARDAAQQAGLVRVVQALRAAFPEAKLVLNRGFELLPQIAPLVDMVAAESLYRRWNPVAARYEEVAEADRQWLLARFDEVRQQHRLPVLAIDYVAAGERALARDVAERIRGGGFVPYVSTPALDQLGVGAVEVLPRRVLMLHDAPLQRPSDLTYASVHQHLSAPVEYLGLVPDYLQVDQQPLPAYPLVGRYAGIVTCFDADSARPALAAWLQRAIAEGVKVVSLCQPGIGGAAALRETFGLQLRDVAAQAPVRVADRQPQIGYELMPRPNVQDFRPIAAPPGAQTLLQLRDARGATMDAVAYTPWGGYALPGYGLTHLPANNNALRWVVDPITFLRQALALPAMPVPDTTTESGRRLLLVHVDGDGFANASDQVGAPLASDVMLREVIERYRVPTTVSVIEGETAPHGLYPKLSERMEATARRIFALPHVEIASHSYSHPFDWEKAAASKAGETGYTLALPGYRYDVEREVGGSIRYIEQRLAPPGKKVRLFLWSGNTNPGEAELAAVERAGIGAINGGDTLITRADPTLTMVAPRGLRKGAHYQVYAPNQNENVYTNHFSAPLYGYERVIETFELTGQPYRLKPINIYYHTYAASRRASLGALHKVYRWALAQPVHALYTSEYVERARNAEQVVVARSGNGFLVRGAHALRQLRAPQALGLPQIADSRALAGYADFGSERYLHLSGDEAWLHFAAAPDSAPMLVDANARVETFETAPGLTRLRLVGHTALNLTLRHTGNCSVKAAGKALTPTASPAAGTHSYAIDHDGRETITIVCP